MPLTCFDNSVLLLYITLQLRETYGMPMGMLNAQGGVE
jgi:hypothetical protein